MAGGPHRHPGVRENCGAPDGPAQHQNGTRPGNAAWQSPGRAIGLRHFRRPPSSARRAWIAANPCPPGTGFAARPFTRIACFIACPIRVENGTAFKPLAQISFLAACPETRKAAKRPSAKGWRCHFRAVAMLGNNAGLPHFGIEGARFRSRASRAKANPPPARVPEFGQDLRAGLRPAPA